MNSSSEIIKNKLMHFQIVISKGKKYAYKMIMINCQLKNSKRRKNKIKINILEKKIE